MPAQRCASGCLLTVHVHLCILSLSCLFSWVRVKACVALRSMARRIFPPQGVMGEMTFNIPGLLPQSILMLVYQTCSLA